MSENKCPVLNYTAGNGKSNMDWRPADYGHNGPFFIRMLLAQHRYLSYP
ncbi:MAG: catalase (peroxidase I) [Gammaproteobacteria bacterium]|jgi:catalase (peroxidase I)